MPQRHRAARGGFARREIDQRSALQTAGAGEERDRIALRERDARAAWHEHLPDAAPAAADTLHLQAARSVRKERLCRSVRARSAILEKHLLPLQHIAF